MKHKKDDLELQINKFIEMYDLDKMNVLFKDILPLIELYHYDDGDDWVEKQVGIENVVNIRLIRTIYLLSRFAHFHAGELCRINVNFKNLWSKMESVMEVKEGENADI